MSGPFDYGNEMSTGDMMEQPYHLYEHQFAPPYPRLAGPPAHMDGVAFWYRPDNTEPMYDHESSMFSQSIALPGSSMEPTGIKHRRTRSGCFTCRSRRVKCDETRPVCHRCKKGNRDCEFPQPTSSTKRIKPTDGRSLPDSYVKQEQKDATITGLDTIKDEDEGEELVSPTTTRRSTLSKARTHSTQSLSRKQKYRNQHDHSPGAKDKASPRSTTSSSSHSHVETPASSFQASATSAEIQARQAKIKSLKPDLQKFLQFQHDHLTHYHYFFKLDPKDFIHYEFIDLAITFEPLLYAVVGFAAYHFEIRKPNARLAHVLRYHSKSLSMLRQSLEKNTKITEATLLTVLQLATFEECLGDWVNLVGHHRAAHTMLLELFTPETIMETDIGRQIFTWYARFDIIAGLIAGNKTRLGREWFAANEAYYLAQIDPDPVSDLDIENTLAYFMSANRLISMDMSVLFAKLPRQEITIEDFSAENLKIVQRIDEMKRKMEAMNDGYYTVQDFPVENLRPLSPDDIVDPYIPGGLFGEALWSLNYMWVDWYSIAQMQKYQTSLLLQLPPPAGLEQISLEQCRIFEAIDRWPDAPEGAILAAHGSLALAIVFLKKDERHTMWARHKLAKIEKLGYVYPPKFRNQMAEMWRLTTELVGIDESVEEWWLPHGEGRPMILMEVRNVVQERHKDDEKRGGSGLEDVRDLKAIFDKLDVRYHSTHVGGVGGTSAASGSDGFSPHSDQSESSRGGGPMNSPPTSATASTAGAMSLGGSASASADETSSITLPISHASRRGSRVSLGEIMTNSKYRDGSGSSGGGPGAGRTASS